MGPKGKLGVRFQSLLAPSWKMRVQIKLAIFGYFHRGFGTGPHIFQNGSKGIIMGQVPDPFGKKLFQDETYRNQPYSIGHPIEPLQILSRSSTDPPRSTTDPHQNNPRSSPDHPQIHSRSSPDHFQILSRRPTQTTPSRGILPCSFPDPIQLLSRSSPAPFQILSRSPPDPPQITSRSPPDPPQISPAPFQILSAPSWKMKVQIKPAILGYFPRGFGTGSHIFQNGSKGISMGQVPDPFGKKLFQDETYRNQLYSIGHPIEPIYFPTWAQREN